MTEIVCLITFLVFVGSNGQPFGPPNHPVVTTSYGQIRGISIDPDQNTHAEIFRGIPYAQPPVGNLRLKKPEPPLPWSGVKDATNDHTTCLQNHHGNGESEDCLKLDIYRPQHTDSSAKLPVMVWIHGGGYTGGSKNINGLNIVSKGVILVAINYRLGPLGYFSTEDDAIPGNFGMLDQVQALKWIQSNIGSFGGDPAKVTIFGGSAGSASCSFHILSPLSKGLFARAIMESGVGSTSRDVPPPSLPVTLRDVAQDVGHQLGCPLDSGYLNCLQSKDALAFFTASMNAAYKDHSSGPFRPRVETTFGFLPDNPLKMLARGEFTHVDTIRGFNSQEQGMSVHDHENDGITRDEFRQLAIQQLSDYPYVDDDVYVKKMEDLYLGNITDPLQIRDKAIQMRSDFTFIGPIVRETKMARSFNHDRKAYLYNFNYRASDAHAPDWAGVLHGSEGQFVFGFQGFKHPSPTDQVVADMMMTMWTNFAKFGDPTPRGTIHSPLVHWDQFYGTNSKYLFIEDTLQIKHFDSPEQLGMLSLYEATVQEYLTALSNPPVVG